MRWSNHERNGGRSCSSAIATAGDVPATKPSSNGFSSTRHGCSTTKTSRQQRRLSRMPYRCMFVLLLHEFIGYGSLIKRNSVYEVFLLSKLFVHTLVDSYISLVVPVLYTCR